MAARTESDRPPSIRDVARVADVSYQTVSRVLNDHPNIRPETRQRVLNAMTELNFRPNRAARRLAMSRSQTVGVVASVQGSYYGPTSIISAFEDAARERGYATLLASPRTLDEDSLRDAIEHLIDEGVEGIVVLAPQARTADVIASIRSPLPIAVLQSDRVPADIGMSVDNHLGASIATRHLLALGHTRLAVVTGPADWVEADARARGFTETLTSAGLAPLAVVPGDWTAESGYLAYQELHGQGATAVFCSNDQMALGLIHAASEHGVRVPVDLSVVGFDDVPEAAHYLPPLTTIQQDFGELGRRAISTLLARLGGGDGEAHLPVPPRLVVRASTMLVHG
ncbi:LacI family DNA-binding transcriptional regulator [Humibacter ginsenosidimutans]|uniref:LacI family transcriptional regulator n=1 Tax=Humibacter ginsenosidimutans TaxID=2599293 RepID=A0A5B8M7V2_9MICO|nr:LacI family DNA-binding transcriptional regulator [Humibacter ginsenosidimutans]QDZ16279.1 LacI family transcriptional regulator [Humibacter ginsenosidimutans]